MNCIFQLDAVANNGECSGFIGRSPGNPGLASSLLFLIKPNHSLES